MKKILSNAGLLCLFILMSCHQEILEQQPVPPISGEAGSADFTKFVSLGNSLTAGYQAGALFQEGQDHSYPTIMAAQFAYVSENDEFNQPNTNSTNGCFNPTGGCTRGRLILFDADGAGTAKTPAPAPAGTPTMPAPFNTDASDHAKALAAYTGDKTKLNNFGVPGIILAQILTPFTGGPASGNPAFNPYYARFASSPGTSTIIGDVLATQPTFFSFWLGNNDVLGYATQGGLFNPAVAIPGAIPMTDPAAFETYYTTAINAILGSNADLKGVVANIPDVTTIPFFRTVSYKPIPLDQATAGLLNGGFAGYNGFLDIIINTPALLANFGHTAVDLESRKISFSASRTNKIVIIDEGLTDLGPVIDYLYFVAGAITQAQYNGLQPYKKARQTTPTDLVCLSAGGIIGTGTLPAINGLTIPLADQYILIPSEIEAIQARILDFNAIIADVVAGSSGRLALADINTKFSDVYNKVTTSVDGLPVNATFAPPAGLFSEDGVHPNNRGSAYIAKAFIEAINAKFGSTVPSPNIATQYSTHLPVMPNP